MRSQSQEPRLKARTTEGLSLEMDVMLEYSLQKENEELKKALAEVTLDNRILKKKF